MNLKSRTQGCLRIMAGVALVSGLGLKQAEALELVKDGEARAAIWYSSAADNKRLAGVEEKLRGRVDTEKAVALDLAAVLKTISGAELQVKSVEQDGPVPADAPAIIVGDLSVTLGMPPPPKTVSGDGYRVQTKGNRLFLAGETPASTYFASTHFLETLGCRWFFDNKIGTVLPSLKTIAVKDLDLEEKPDFRSRSIWGPNWGRSDWTRRNRLGGLSMNTGHNWPSWFCTTDPEVQKSYISNAIERSKGATSISISPPDGTRYCTCERCKALDDPSYREPSSDSVVMSDRFQEFYNLVGEAVKKVYPDVILNHYAYADYTLPPKRVRTAPDNLCIWIAPIRFCRLHSLSNPICPARQRCREVIEDWMKVESQMGWREYNYNLAELCVPFSKISVWKDDFPLLHKLGCIGINVESLVHWHLYGINTYRAARLCWDAEADVDAIMDDFYTRFCGPAAPHVKAYWERIDKAYREADVHAGSFHGIHVMWTPELLAACQADLAAAAKAAGKDDLIAQRVAMFQMGLDNARYYLDLRAAWNRCDFAAAKKIYDEWMAHMDRIHAEGIHQVGEYKRGYAPRFVGVGVEAGYARVTDGRRLVLQLPDEWDFRYDPTNEGESNGWFKAVVEPEGWTKVKTYSATLNEQKIPEQLTWMWYRTTIRTPKKLPDGPLHLFFMEPDANDMKIWLNGELAADLTSGIKSRQPLDVDLTGKLKPDQEIQVTIRMWHRRISELALGGLLKPVMLYSGGVPVPPAPPAKKADEPKKDAKH
jgi:hypothetical protein